MNGVNCQYNRRSHEAHDQLATRLRRCNAKWMLSTYDDADSRRRYAGRHITPIRSKPGMSDGHQGRHANTETLVTDYQPRAQTLV